MDTTGLKKGAKSEESLQFSDSYLHSVNEMGELVQKILCKPAFAAELSGHPYLAGPVRWLAQQCSSGKPMTTFRTWLEESCANSLVARDYLELAWTVRDDRQLRLPEEFVELLEALSHRKKFKL